jgi:hypothetical protein
MPLQEDELKAAIRAQDRDKIKKILAARAGHGRLNVVRDVLHAGVKRDPTKFSNHLLLALVLRVPIVRVRARCLFASTSARCWLSCVEKAVERLCSASPSPRRRRARSR